MDTATFIAVIQNLIASGASNDDIANAAKQQLDAIAAEELAAIHAAEQKAAYDAEIAAKIARATPLMLSNIGLTNGMNQDDVLAKILKYYPDL